MARSLHQIIAHLRACVKNNSIHTTLIPTEDLMVLCDAADPGPNVDVIWSFFDNKEQHKTILETWAANPSSAETVAEIVCHMFFTDSNDFNTVTINIHSPQSAVGQYEVRLKRVTQTRARKL